MTSIEETARRAKDAALRLAGLPTEAKNRALQGMAGLVRECRADILAANEEDVRRAAELVANGALSKPLLDRLKLSGDKVLGMAQGVESVAQLPDPVGQTLSAVELDDGLELRQVSCPIGVIGAIFESRPDAVPQIASLCWKSGNAVILKGGTEAQESNRVLVNLLRRAIAAVDSALADAVQMIETREDVRALLQLENHIDLFVPRGSNDFVRYIQDNTRAPVLGHADGICHAYVDEHADVEQAVAVCYDAKVQYPAVCNAIETVLVHRRVAPTFLPLLANAYEQAGVEMRGCSATRTLLPNIVPATEEDWDTEYLDLIVSIRLVDDLEDSDCPRQPPRVGPHRHHRHGGSDKPPNASSTVLTPPPSCTTLPPGLPTASASAKAPKSASAPTRPTPVARSGWRGWCFTNTASADAATWSQTTSGRRPGRSPTAACPQTNASPVVSIEFRAPHHTQHLSEPRNLFFDRQRLQHLLLCVRLKGQM